MRRAAALSIGGTARPGGLRRGVLLVLLAVAWILAPPAASQSSGLEFDAEAVTLLSNRAEQPRLDIYVRVPYPSLRFVRRGGGFEGTYTLTASVYRAGRGDRRPGLVATRTWDRQVSAGDFSATQSERHLDHSLQSLELPPGRYVLDLRLEDGVSARSASREHVVEVRPLDGRVAMSDVVIADAYDRRTRALSPIVGGAVPSDQDAFTLFFEAYAERRERLRAHYTILKLGPERRAGFLAALFGRGQREATPVMQFAAWISTDEHRTPVARSFQTQRFEAGEYEVQIRLEDADGTVVAERGRPFIIRWTGLFDQLQDLDVAIAQLRYIAKPHELRAMLEARSFDERLRLFQEFWDKRDPSPSSPRNERMEEYYYRVAHANRHYGRLDGRGWETDQGEVFIRFGEPDRVEERRGDGGARDYQVWYYERIGQRFVFLDDSGRGDFRLVAPRWDDRSRW